MGNSKIWVGPVMKPGAVLLGDDVLRNPTFADEDGVATMAPLKGVRITGWTDADGVEHAF